MNLWKNYFFLKKIKLKKLLKKCVKSISKGMKSFLKMSFDGKWKRFMTPCIRNIFKN